MTTTPTTRPRLPPCWKRRAAPASGRVIAIVQPHRYSRLKSLFEEFCDCFGNSDTVIVTPVYSAGEEPNGVDRDTLVEGVRLHGHRQVLPVDGEDALPA